MQSNAHRQQHVEVQTFAGASHCIFHHIFYYVRAICTPHSLANGSTVTLSFAAMLPPEKEQGIGMTLLTCSYVVLTLEPPNQRLTPSDLLCSRMCSARHCRWLQPMPAALRQLLQQLQQHSRAI